jgi:hypothetical protein
MCPVGQPRHSTALIPTYQSRLTQRGPRRSIHQTYQVFFGSIDDIGGQQVCLAAQRCARLDLYRFDIGGGILAELPRERDRGDLHGGGGVDRLHLSGLIRV